MRDATTRTTGRIICAAATMGLVAALATGCQIGVGDDAAPSDGATRSAASGSATSGSAVDGGVGAAGVDLSKLGKPSATAEIPVSVDGDTDATMTVAVYGLERRGKTLVATFSFVVHSDATEQSSLFTYLGGHSWRPYAIDTVNLNKHEVMSSDDGYAQTDDSSLSFRPGQTAYAYATFAAPPDGVKDMDVMMVDGAPLAKGVAVS